MVTSAVALWSRLTAHEDAFPKPRDDRRPSISMNMVVSLDGRASLDGRVGELTGLADQALLHHLRAQSDAVLVGSRTVVAEGYGRLLPSGTPYPRSAEGRGLQPFLVIPTTQPIRLAGTDALNDLGSDLLLATAIDVELPPARRPIRTLGVAAAVDDEVDLRRTLERLREDHAVQRVVCEGGPTLARRLFQADLVDDLYIAISPRIGGHGASKALVDGSLGLVQMELLGSATADSFAFLRYRVNPG